MQERTILRVRETQNCGALASFLFLILSPHVARLRQTRVEVKDGLPETGAAFFAGNHEDMLDSSALIWFFARYTKRIPRVVLRDSLIHPEIEESEKVLKRTGKEGENLHKGGLLRHAVALYCRQVDHIKVRRGGNYEQTKAFEGEVNESFDQGRIVYMYGQETRRPKKDLREFRMGPAIIASQNPDVPVYPIGISGSVLDIGHGIIGFWRSLRGPVIIRVGAPFTYNQILNDPQYDVTDVRDFHRFLVSKVADLIPDNLKTEYLQYEKFKAERDRKAAESKILTSDTI